MTGTVNCSHKPSAGTKIVLGVIAVLILLLVIYWENQFTFVSFFPHL